LLIFIPTIRFRNIMHGFRKQYQLFHHDRYVFFSLLLPT
jgi:hypothetical protein